MDRSRVSRTHVKRLVPGRAAKMAALTLMVLSGAVSQWWSGPVTARAQEKRTTLEGVFTDLQANRGQTEYAAACATCHEPDLKGGRGRELAGQNFIARWTPRSVHQLFTEMKTRMPRDTPGSLSDQAYIDIAAFILRSNGFPSGGEDLPLREGDLEAIVITRESSEAPAGPLPTGTLVQVVGCLDQSAEGGWMLRNTTTPVRTTSPDPAKGAALERLQQSALGEETFRLLGIYTSLDARKGHRVEGRGFLVRDPSGDRLNVVNLETVASTCP